MTDLKYMRPGLPFAIGKAVEELGELQAALGKTLRWGWQSSNPELPPNARETNIDWVRREIADVRHALDNLEGEISKSFPTKEPARKRSCDDELVADWSRAVTEEHELSERSR